MRSTSPIRGFALRTRLPDGRPIFLGGACLSVVEARQRIEETCVSLAEKLGYTLAPEETVGWLLNRVPDDRLLAEFGARNHVTDHPAVLMLCVVEGALTQ